MDDDDVVALIVFAVLVIAAFYMYRQQQGDAQKTALALAQAQENIVSQQIAYDKTPQGVIQNDLGAVGNIAAMVVKAIAI